jgi:hypothetical protein
VPVAKLKADLPITAASRASACSLRKAAADLALHIAVKLGTNCGDCGGVRAVRSRVVGSSAIRSGASETRRCASS